MGIIDARLSVYHVLVVFLRGINVGGHRTFRPSVLAKQLRRFDVVNVGAAGTFVVRKPVTHARLRAAIARHLPFVAHVMICNGRDILRIVASNPLANEQTGKHIVHFVSVLATQRVPKSRLPLRIPATGEWSVRVIGQQGRFVYGIYRRHMKSIGYLGDLDTLFGAPATTRSWSTITAIARILRS